MHLRSEKLGSAKKLGKLWPRREYLRNMSEADPMNVLFVCSRNQWRSPTGEALLKRVNGMNARSAGTNRNARRVLSITDIRWADVIFVMEQKHKSRMVAEFRQETNYKEIHVLDVPDEFQYMDPDLIDILSSKLSDHLQIHIN